MPGDDAGLPNPLRPAVAGTRVPDPCVMVIFGGTGDLSRRKLIPALASLSREGHLPAGFSVVGIGRNPKSHEAYRNELREAVSSHSRHGPGGEGDFAALSEGIWYQAGDIGDPELYRSLRTLLDEIDRTRGTAGNRILYLAVPPSFQNAIIRGAGEHGVVGRRAEGPGYGRIIIEKPFGRDLETAAALNREVGAVFDERQVYRIDHYLGKETVQNIMVFRFANGIMEPLWNRAHIDHVQITVSESLGVEGRGTYFEEAGACRDIVQNHMLQLLCLVAMEPPVSVDPDAVRDEKVKVLRAVHAVEPYRDVVRGQYAAGSVNGERVPGYRDEPGVPRDSRTESFVALRLFVDSWRFAGVPFYLRTGKRLPRRVTEIALQFRSAPLPLFRQPGGATLEADSLVMRIQPDEGISLKFLSKFPGPSMRIQPVRMDFRYGTSFGVESPDAYERLLLDAMLGDSTLFTRRDEVEAAWRIVDPILDHWRADAGTPVPFYEAGSFGPSEADDMLAEDGRRWRRV